MNKKKILLIDDEHDLVAMVKMRLEANGYEVLTAFNGEEGLEVAKDDKPDIILLDIMMPKKDGYSVLKDLKADDNLKKTPVIILTAKPKMKDLFEIEGVKYYVVKPIDDKELLDKIKDALGGE